MNAPTDDQPNSSSEHALFPKSRRVTVSGKIHPFVEVPFREVLQSDSKRPDGSVEENPALRVYDTSGPWGDADFKGDVSKGLPALRRGWIEDRGDVEEYEGRDVSPQDNGYLSGIAVDMEYRWSLLPSNTLK